ncbi:MAG: hypothetical protein K9M45_09495 [Kiritimatiellales bacterium]|nr:hypothetical protein [Kiritimatiellales bacterium]
MNKPVSPACPHCGSHQLVSRVASRKVYIDHEGECIPLLTANFNLGNPVVENSATIYSCSCSWTGTIDNMEPG